MGLRARKSIKIAPGLKINLNKGGTSLTIERPERVSMRAKEEPAPPWACPERAYPTARA